MGLFDAVTRFNDWRKAMSNDIKEYSRSIDDFDSKTMKKLKDSIIKSPLPESLKRMNTGKDWFEISDWLISNDPYFRYSPIVDDIKKLLSMKKEVRDKSNKEAVYGVNSANSLIENKIRELTESFYNLDCWLLVGQGSIRWIDDFNKKFYE
jgi:hypothetical protein